MTDLNEIKVYTEDNEPLRIALETITDEWVFSGQSCDQTVIDLRDACRTLLAEVERLHFILEAQGDDHERMVDEIDILEKREKGHLSELTDYGRTVTRLNRENAIREALEYYAEGGTYFEGKRARAALKGGE